MKKYLQMKDFLTVKSPKDIFIDLKDGKDLPESLLVHVKATHSGIINGNRRFYRPDKMESSVPTWKDAGYDKPVLVKHDNGGEVLGRVREAKYIDVTNQYSEQFDNLDKLFFSKKNRDSKNSYSLFKSIDWIVDNLMSDSNYEGLGYIDLGLQITDPVAVRKVLKSEYLTVSVGFKTDSCVCSVCHQDWAVDDRCEHKPGSKVDGKPVYSITGNFIYDEVSFVNFPADPFATVVSVEKLQDSVNKMFFLGLPTSKQDILTTSMSDSIEDVYSSSLGVIYEDQLETMTIQDLDLNEVAKQLKATDLVKEKAEEYKKIIESWIPETDSDKSRKRSLLSAINVKFTKEGWSPAILDTTTEPLEAVEDSTEQAVEANTTENKGTNDIKDAVEEDLTDCPSCTYEDSEFILTEPRDIKYFAKESKVYKKIARYIPEVLPTGEDATVTDATLSTEARKKLKGSTFCGPNRSFPVPDKAHYIAALRLLNRAKVSEATKTRISACIMRKGKAAGWTSKTDEISTSIFEDVRANNALLDAKIKQGEYPSTVIQKYDELDNMHGDMDRKDRRRMRMLHSALHDHWMTKEGLETAKEYMGTPEGQDALLESFYIKYDGLKDIAEKLNFKDNISEDALKLVTALDKLFHSLPAGEESTNERTALQTLVASLNQKWDAHCWFEYAKERMETLDHVVKSKKENASDEDVINKLSQERDSVIAKLEAEHTKVIAYADEVKKAYAQQISILRAAKSLKDFKNIDANTILQKSKELSQRSIVSLKDTINDLLSEESQELNTDNISDKPVGDNLNLSENSQQDTTDTNSQEQSHSDELELRYLTPAELIRHRALAEYKSKLTK